MARTWPLAPWPVVGAESMAKPAVRANLGVIIAAPVPAYNQDSTSGLSGPSQPHHDGCATDCSINESFERCRFLIIVDKIIVIIEERFTALAGQNVAAVAKDMELNRPDHDPSAGFVI